LPTVPFRRATLGLLAGLAALALAVPARAQLTFPGASPISAGNVIVRTQPGFTEGTDGVRSVVDKNVLIYGASPDLAFIVQNNSVVANSANVGGGGQAREETALGFGDTLLEGRYTVFRVDGVGSTFRVAPYVGVSIPTGMDNANAALPRAGQPGTGAWASRDALTASWQTLFWNGGAEVGYQTNAAADGYRFGNVFYADLGFHYLLWPSHLEGDVPAELYASLEANYTSQNANRAAGGKVPGTGAQLLLLDPGLIYTRRNYSVSFTALLPAFERLRDGGSRYDFGGILFIRYSLFTALHW
jgi:hypothetical protein